MIPFDFDYYRPDTLEELSNLMKQLVIENKSPVYYGGGTEIISMARADSIRFDSVIDIKEIPECNILRIENNVLILGSAVTLTLIAESGLYPLLGETVTRIADHTIQDKITIGGNIAGTIIYREAALPLMLTSSRVKIMTESGGLQEVSFSSVFDGRLQLKKGECILQFLIDQSDLNLPYNHVKKTKIDKIDYPILSFSAIKKENAIHAAVSGLSQHPFLLNDSILNDINVPVSKRIENMIASVQDKIMNDLSGSKGYRIFMLTNVLRQMYDNFKE